MNKFTGIEHNAPVVGLTIADFVNGWCVYELWREQELMYLGVCALGRVFSLPDARSIGEFIRLVKPTDKISVAVRYTGTRMECYNRRGFMLRQLAVPPVINQYVHTKAKTVIVCDQDGIEYRTQHEVCAAYGLNQGNLSSHLNGRPGFASIKGFTFSRRLPKGDRAQ